jgi:S-adenosylmethionine-diacylglycerol 3-amino-3-carboxypropyl transferase
LNVKHLYGFGISQEDERTEAAVLLDGARRVLSICSAGEMPLCLLALGAREIDAVDIDDGQLHLARLKRAAVLALDRVEAIRFLGYLPCPRGERVAALGRVLRELPPTSRAFWSENLRAVVVGPIWAGRYERYVGGLSRLLRPLVGRRLDELFSCTSLEEQADCFRRSFDRPWLRMIFELAFHPRIFVRRGMDPRSLQHRRQTLSLGRQYFDQFRTICTATPARENHLLQLHLLGRVISTEAVPAYLTAPGFEEVRRRIDRLQLRHLDLHAALREGPAGTYDRFHLSNLPDWISPDAFEATMHLLAERSGRSGYAVWRFIHVDRPVPDALREVIRVDRERGRELLGRDRFPFYTIVPAAIEGGR